MHFSGLGSMMQPHFRKGPIERPYVATEKEEALRELYFFDLAGRRDLHCPARHDRMSLPIGMPNARSWSPQSRNSAPAPALHGRGKDGLRSRGAAH